MKKLRIIEWLCLAALIISCAAAPQVRETPAKSDHLQAARPPETASRVEAASKTSIEVLPAEPQASETLAQEDQVTPLANPIEIREPQISRTMAREERLPAARPPKRPFKPPVPVYIMGKGIISPQDMAVFLISTNPNIEKNFIENLASIYTEEAAIEGVNHDTAFAQMCLETGFLRFGGLVTADQYNFCGLGATGPGQSGERFPDPRTGIRAHIQHLKAYATDAPLKQELVDPRYYFVRGGSSPAIKGLSGTWAVDKDYADKINNILERLYNYSFVEKSS